MEASHLQQAFHAFPLLKQQSVGPRLSSHIVLLWVSALDRDQLLTEVFSFRGEGSSLSLLPWSGQFKEFPTYIYPTF